MTNINPQILPLMEIKPNEGGGKAQGLARLAKLGLPIPPTLVVLNATPGNMPENLESLWKDLDGGLAAVRSSAMNEDGEAASAAGQYESELNVEAGHLEQALRRCLESKDSRRVAAYEESLSGQDGGEMAVVIQKMVRSDYAGVLFTADPISGDRGVLVLEAVAGLGEALVAGHAEATRYVMEKDSGEIHESEENPGNIRLSDSVLEQLRAEALLAAEDWGCPLDLEWAVENDAVVWLQSRPITALADSLDTPVTPDELITRCNIGEMFPGAATPLTLSLFGRSLSSGLARYYRSFGALRRKDPNPNFIPSFDDQLFMNLSAMYVMARRVAGATAEGTELGILGYALPAHDIGPKAAALIRGINGLRYFGGLFTWKSKLKAIEKLAGDFRLATFKKSATEIRKLIAEAQEPVLDRAIALHYRCSAFSGAMNAALAITLSGGNTITEEAHVLMAHLLSDIPGIESAAVLEGLEHLASLLRNEDLGDRVVQGDTDSAHAFLLTAEAGKAGIAYRDFLERHGHRCIREAEYREPEWLRRPDDLIDSLRSLVRSGPTAKPKSSGIAPTLPEGVNPKVIAWIVKNCKTGVRTRERSKSMLILINHQFKLAARALGEALESEGVLKDRDLAYFLTIDEIGDLLTGRVEGLPSRAERRRRRYGERMALRFPDLSTGRPLPEAPPVPEGGMVMKGTPVSPGIVDGRVRVILNREDAEKLQDGEIMVALFTDIGWTPFYGRAGGMVTEIGGALSHGSVVAREYGLPLVGGLTGACAALETGMRVRVDGGAGTVMVLDEVIDEDRDSADATAGMVCT